MTAVRAAALLALAASCATLRDASAAIYRCVDGDGRTAFRDKPCSGKDKQTRLGGAPGNLAGCYQVDDSTEWEGGGGRWRLSIDFDDGAYLFKDMTAIENGKEQETQFANVPLHRASPEELEAATKQLLHKVTSGLVLELPENPNDKRVMGFFNAWDQEGQLQFIAYLPFVNGVARRVACP